MSVRRRSGAKQRCSRCGRHPRRPSSWRSPPLATSHEISLGEVVVQRKSCAARSVTMACAPSFFPSDLAIDPSDTILEAEGMELSSVEDLSAVLDGKLPGDTIDLKIRRPDVGVLDVTVELAASPDDPRPHDRRIPPVRHPSRHAAVRGRYRHGPDRGPVRRPGVHARSDRRADRWRSDWWAEHRGDWHDLARRLGRANRRLGRRRPARSRQHQCRRVPGAGRAARVGRG